MTETCSHVALREIKNSESTSEQIYKSLKNISFALSDKQTLKIMAPNLIDAPITTNDMVNLIDEHSFAWIGRSDFIINSGGIKVSPERVEEQISDLIKSPFFISSTQTEKYGEEICLVLEKKCSFYR